MAHGTGPDVILADTTVWVDFFHGNDTPQVAELESCIASGEDICLCGVILTEILQGIRDDSEYARTLALFDSFPLLPMERHTFVIAVELYRTLRKRGITIRKTIDCLIAAVAIEHDIPLLHNDGDFDPMEKFCGLKVIHLH